MYFYGFFYNEVFLLSFYFVLLFFSLICLVCIMVCFNPMWSLLFFNGFVFCVCLFLSFLDLFFYSVVFIVIYIGAITIFFIFLIMVIDFRAIKNFSIYGDNVLISLFFICLIFFGFFLSFYNVSSLSGVFFEIPFNFDFSSLSHSVFVKQIGFLFITDFFVFILLCFLLLIGIILYLIGFEDLEKLQNMYL